MEISSALARIGPSPIVQRPRPGCGIEMYLHICMSSVLIVVCLNKSNIAGHKLQSPQRWLYAITLGLQRLIAQCCKC